MAVKMGIESRKICRRLGIGYRSATLSRTLARRLQMTGMLTRRKSIHPGLGFIGSARGHAQKRQESVVKIRRLIPMNIAKPWNQGFRNSRTRL
jgi:hypothetical protein